MTYFRDRSKYRNMEEKQMIVYRYRMRLTALLLAMLMVLGLTGCDGGGKNEDNKEQLSSKIYLPTYVDIDMDLRDVTDG